eukprot:6167765-Ditylum_brightwellii.AAC.1
MGVGGCRYPISFNTILSSLPFFAFVYKSAPGRLAGYILWASCQVPVVSRRGKNGCPLNCMHRALICTMHQNKCTMSFLMQYTVQLVGLQWCLLLLTWSSQPLGHKIKASQVFVALCFSTLGKGVVKYLVLGPIAGHGVTLVLSRHVVNAQ